MVSGTAASVAWSKRNQAAQRTGTVTARVRCRALGRSRTRPLFQLPPGPRIRASELVGIYEDLGNPQGGTVKLELLEKNPQQFRLTHSVYGPLRGIGRISDCHIEIGNMKATFSEGKLLWDNGVETRKLGRGPSGSATSRRQMVSSRLPTLAEMETLDQGQPVAGCARCRDEGPAAKSLQVNASAMARAMRRWKEVWQDPSMSKSRLFPSDTVIEKGLENMQGILRSRSDLIAADGMPISFSSLCAFFSPAFLTREFIDALPIWREVGIDCQSFEELVGACHAELQCDTGKERACFVFNRLVKVLPGWASLSAPRASRLFIKDLGSFDVRQAVETLTEMLVSCPECASQSGRLHLTITKLELKTPCVFEFQLLGYLRKFETPQNREWLVSRLIFNNKYSGYDGFRIFEPLHSVFALPHDDVAFKFFVKHHQWFFSEERHFNRLDELVRLGEHLTPKEILGVKYGPRRVLDSAIEAATMDVQHTDFAWMQGCFEEKLLPSGNTLVPLQSSTAVLDTRREMRNCAVQYIRDIVAEECVLVKLVNTEGKALALGRYAMQSRRWDEISGARNSAVAADLRNEFTGYKPIDLGGKS